MIDDALSHAAALLIIRLVAGILFFFQAYDKIFRLGLGKVADSFTRVPFQASRQVIYICITFSSLIELIGGLLLLIGFLTIPAAMLLGFNMAVVAVVFSFIRPMWDMQFYFPRLVLILLILLLPHAWDTWSLDAFLTNRGLMTDYINH